MGFSTYIMGIARPLRSPFTLWERLLLPDRPALCTVYLKMRETLGKFLLQLPPLWPNVFFSPMVCLNLPYGRLDFCTLSFMCEYLPRSALSSFFFFFSNGAKRGLSMFTVFPGSTACSEVCLLTTRCTGGCKPFWVPWPIVLDPITSQKHFCLRMDIYFIV